MSIFPIADTLPTISEAAAEVRAEVDRRRAPAPVPDPKILAGALC